MVGNSTYASSAFFIPYLKGRTLGDKKYSHFISGNMLRSPSIPYNSTLSVAGSSRRRGLPLVCPTVSNDATLDQTINYSLRGRGGIFYLQAKGFTFQNAASPFLHSPHWRECSVSAYSGEGFERSASRHSRFVSPFSNDSFPDRFFHARGALPVVYEHPSYRWVAPLFSIRHSVQFFHIGIFRLDKVVNRSGGHWVKVSAAGRFAAEPRSLRHFVHLFHNSFNISGFNKGGAERPGGKLASGRFATLIFQPASETFSFQKPLIGGGGGRGMGSSIGNDNHTCAPFFSDHPTETTSNHRAAIRRAETCPNDQRRPVRVAPYLHTTAKRSKCRAIVESSF